MLFEKCVYLDVMNIWILTIFLTTQEIVVILDSGAIGKTVTVCSGFTEWNPFAVFFVFAKIQTFFQRFWFSITPMVTLIVKQQKTTHKIWMPDNNSNFLNTLWYVTDTYVANSRFIALKATDEGHTKDQQNEKLPHLFLKITLDWNFLIMIYFLTSTSFAQSLNIYRINR